MKIYKGTEYDMGRSISIVTLKYRLSVFAGKSYAEYFNFACNLPVENKRSDLTL